MDIEKLESLLFEEELTKEQENLCKSKINELLGSEKYITEELAEKYTPTKSNKIPYILIGATLGLLIVKAFLLDGSEEIGWRIFWEGLFKGQLDSGDLEIVLKSTTFLKSVSGLIIGGVVGAFSSTLTAKN